MTSFVPLFPCPPGQGTASFRPAPAASSAAECWARAVSAAERGGAAAPGAATHHLRKAATSLSHLAAQAAGAARRV
ncbi:hypothetical protein R5R35_000629 [Gryllus longicercus]|uniref:Uncharacterized protein n=1 Tax=Gryllus longicercus TaxID=2509291 RepID=A0AAN9Z9T8_9ORTH